MNAHRVTEDGLARLVEALHVAFQPDRPKILQALRELATYTPEVTPRQFTVKGNPYRGRSQKELDESSAAPFFSESYLYNLLGKEDARSLLSRFRALCAVLGINEDDVFKDDE